MLLLTVVSSGEHDDQLELHVNIKDASKHLGMMCAEVGDRGVIYALKQVGTCTVQSTVEVTDAEHLRTLLETSTPEPETD